MQSMMTIELDALVEWDAPAAETRRAEAEYPGPYVVLDSAFHKGGIISRHRTLAGALRAARRVRKAHRPDCCCGRGHVVPAREAKAYDPDMHYASPCR